MKNFEKLYKYDFHDSLVEEILYDKENKKVTIEVDFCNWKQEWYDEKEDETIPLQLIFEDVHEVNIPQMQLNSDEIVSFEVLSKDGENSGIRVTLLNDIKNIAYDIHIYAESVAVAYK